jgi:ferrochelatase
MGKQSFLNAGGESFTMIPCLNTNSSWVKTVAMWANNYKEGDKTMLLS